MTFELAEMARKDRREQIAMRCLQGLLANPHQSVVLAFPEDAAYLAVLHADALMAELDKPAEPVKGGKQCVGCNRILSADHFAKASPSHPTRDGRVYKCRECVKEASQ